jgi:hypothetical protein
VRVAGMIKEGTPDSCGEFSSPDLFLFYENSALGLSTRQIVAWVVAITWVPLVVLGAVQGLAWGPSRAQSVLLDPMILARFLAALPILIISSGKCSQIVNAVGGHFLEAGLVTEAELGHFSTIVSSQIKLRNSRAANWICVVLACVCSALMTVLILPRTPISWRTANWGGQHSSSLAGWWFVAVSQPIYLFVLLRFLYRIALWWRFLWKTSRLNLQLHAVHPDGAGGLGFLGLTLDAFKLPAFGISASFAGSLADLILLKALPTNEIKYEILGVALIVVGLFVLPLSLFYSRELTRARDRDVLNYWALVEAQLRQFERKWIASDSKQANMPSGADFSEAASLSSILERAQRMTLLPFRLGDFLSLVAAVLLPFLPVAALVVPLSNILKTILRLIA